MVATRYKTAFQLYPYQRVPDQDRADPRRHPVVIVGDGLIGMALDLGRRGTPVLVQDDHDGVGMGARAICCAKRTLEICDRLGCGQPMVDKGVVWNLGRVYRDETEIYSFNLLPEEGHRLNARLVLILSNHIGDHHVLNQALTLARGSAHATDTDPAKA